MTKVYQTRIGSEGNCFQACVASLLDLPLEAVPDFCRIGPVDSWWERFQEWLDLFHLGAVNVHLDPERQLRLSRPPHQQQVILSGRTGRHASLLHAVVGQWNELTMTFDVLFDPHPDGDGLVEVTEILFIVSTRPGRGLRDDLMTCCVCGKQFLSADESEITARGFVCPACTPPV